MEEKKNTIKTTEPNPNPPKKPYHRRSKEEIMQAKAEKKKADDEKRWKRNYGRWLKKWREELKRRAKKKEREREKERKKREAIREREKEKRRKAREKAKHKKRRGRPRKPGPKKKYRRKKPPKVRVYKRLPPFNYEIVECLNGVQIRRKGKYRYIEAAYEKFNELKAMDEKVIFPAKITGDLYLKNSNYEYLLLEKITDPDELGKPSILRNEFGKLVEQRTNNEEWRILDKFQYKKEETFYMYGISPTSWKERKTFDWIYANKVINGIESKFDFKRVIILFNKIVIKDDNNNMEIVFCKDESDAVRFYNLLEQWVKRDKIKQVLFLGSYGEDDEKREKLAKEIMELTGWKRKKVVMKTTTYYSSARRLLERKQAEEKKDINQNPEEDNSKPENLENSE